MTIYQMFQAKMRIFALPIFLAAFVAVQLPNLEAGGWGKTDHAIEYEGELWTEVYFDMDGLYFTASLPNYSHAVLNNGIVTLYGNAEVENIAYAIITTLQEGFTPPKTLDEFVAMVQEANPDYIVTAIDAKKLGSKYAIDMVPNHPEETVFWRFLATKNRLIKMGTDDANASRQLHFFESFHIG